MQQTQAHQHPLILANDVAADAPLSLAMPRRIQQDTNVAEQGRLS